MAKKELTISVKTQCPFCGKVRVLENIPRHRFFEWKEGYKNIQDALPELSADDREALMTGICNKCYPTD